MIPLLRPSCTEAEIAAVAEVLRSGWWGQGPVCAEFERQLAARYGRQHCVTTNSATAALFLALKVNGVQAGDEVIVPALTFASSALAVLHLGAKPVFADVDADDLCIDCTPFFEDVFEGKRPVEAVIAVDFAGYPSLELPICMPDGHGRGDYVPIIQDAAHSAGGFDGEENALCLSFHPVKNLATGDGGAILLDDDEQAERLRRLRWCGIDKSTWNRTGERYAWDYEINELGYKAHWNDIQAAIGLVQLGRLDAMNARRRQIAERYTAALADVCQVPADHPQHTWHLWIMRVDAERRDSLIAELAAKGIAAGVHYKPLTEFGIFKGHPTPPVTAREWRRLVSLPIFPDMTDSDQEQVIAAVRAALLRRAA